MRGDGEDGSNRWLIAGRSVLSTTTLETSLSFSYKMEYLHTLWSGNSTLMYPPKINFYMHSRNDKGHDSIACRAKILEIVQVSINKVKNYNLQWNDSTTASCNSMAES